MGIIRNLKVKRIIKKIDKSIIVKFGRNLECEPTENRIFIAYKTNEVDRKTFMNYVKELDPQCPFDDITLGILHEIGHIFTHDEDLEDDYNFCVELLSKLYQEKKLTDVEINEMYVRLDLEQLATQWAVDFARENELLTMELAKAVGVM